MEINFDRIPIENNQLDHRFELKVNDYTVFIDYKKSGNVYALIHTESPAELKGTGAAKILVEKTFRYIEENGFTVKPYCPFVLAYLKRNPDWKRIVDKNFPEF